MESLLIAIGIIAAIFAVAWIFGSVDEGLREKTGEGFSDWFMKILFGIVSFAVGCGGIYLVSWGMSIQSVPLIIFGLFVMMVGYGFLWSIFL